LYSLLCPNLILDSLHDLEHKSLKELGIKGIIFDLDNTIIPWDSQHMSLEIIELLKSLIANGFKICLLSNNMDKRVKNIAEKFGIPFVSRAYKPAKSGFRNAVTAMSLSSNQVAVVGDQLFTDILGGNRAGLVTIWVKPLSTREFIGTKITRRLEKIAVQILKAKGLLK
jgi:HAD superfamily phosphatase (TIGR01668 family)